MNTDTISFKGKQYNKTIIIMTVRWYVAYPLSYRNVEELLKERGTSVDHSSAQRWVVEYAPLLEQAFRKNYKRPTGLSWRMDETYVKNDGKWWVLSQSFEKDKFTLEFVG